MDLNDGILFSIAGFAISVFRMATPMLFASLGGFLSERSGVIQIGLEGIMLAGAFTAATTAYFTQSVEIAWMAAFVVGLLCTSIYAVFVLYFKADQVVTGMALNLAMAGLIPFLSKIIFNSTGSTPSLPIELRFTYFPIALALFLFIVLGYWSSHTHSGLWHKMAGEKPKALEVSGISALAVRSWSVILSGGIVAWGGASLSLFLASSYSPLMTSGRGFMALAALIFGRWKPKGALFACLLFGVTEAMQIRLQGQKWGDSQIPVQLIQMLPYLLTIVALAGFAGKNKAPAELGKQIN